MDGSFNVVASHEMMNMHTNGSAVDNHKSVVTMAEVSSQEITSAETPQQPQAVSCALEQQSLSTVYVQKPSSLPSLPSISSGVVPRAMSEHHAPKIRLLTRVPAVRSMSSPPPSFHQEEPEINTLGIKNSISPRAQSLDSCDSSQSGKFDDYLAPKNSLSSDNSVDYTDSTGVDLEEFIIQTLKNPRDKKMLLRLENDFTNFINDPRPILQYPPMTSYHRMIVHRVAAYFGMDHNVDISGKSVVMNKTVNTRIPEFKFREFLSRENSEDDSSGNGPRTILKRESMEEGTPPKVESPKPSSSSGVHPLEEKKSKSFEEREEEYSKARARIFNQESMSSHSSQSSKDGGDLEPIQILQATRDSDSTESESKDLQPPSDEQAPHDPEKTAAQDESPSQAQDNKNLTAKEISKTAISQATSPEKPQQQQGYKGYGGSKGRQHSGSTSSVPVWAAEGVPIMAPGPGDMQMFPYPGMVPMMPPQHPPKPMSIPEYHSQPPGGMMWNFPVDASWKRSPGTAYINPQTGIMTPDGMTVYPPAPYHTMADVKPTPPGHPGYMPYLQHPSATTSQSVQQPVQVQSPPHHQQQPQQMIPQPYYGMQQQPVYYMPQQTRPQFATPQTLDPNQRWPSQSQQPPSQVAQSPTGSSYPDISQQFAGMSLVPRPGEMESQQQQRVTGDSSAQCPVSYGSVQPQVMQAQHPNIQYIFVSPQGQYRPGIPVIAQQMPQQGSNQQQQQAYIYGQQIYHGQMPQYGLCTDPVLQTRPKTPPTPPRTTSPIISSPQFSQTGPNSRQMTQPQQTLTPPYQPRASPHNPSTRPFLIQGPHGLSLHPPHVVPMGHSATGAPPQHIPTSPPAFLFPQGHMLPQQQMVHRKGPSDRRSGKADIYTPDNAPKSQSSPVTSPSQAVNPGVQYWTGHNIRPGFHPPAQLPPRLDLSQTRFFQGQAMGNQQQYQFQQFTKNKPRVYKQRQGPKPSSSESFQSKRGGGSSTGMSSNQDTEKSTATSPSITTSSGTGASHILEVYDYPEGIKNHQADLLFDELKKTGARIQWLSNSGPSSSPPQGGGSSVLLAIFSSSAQAQHALDTINSSSYKLRVPPHHTVLQKTSDGIQKKI